MSKNTYEDFNFEELVKLTAFEIKTSIEKIFTLSPDRLYPFIENHLNDFLTHDAYIGRIFIEKIFTLSPNRLYPFIENNLNDFLTKEPYISKIFIEELFKLEIDKISPIIGNNILKFLNNASNYFFKKSFYQVDSCILNSFFEEFGVTICESANISNILNELVESSSELFRIIPNEANLSKLLEIYSDSNLDDIQNSIIELMITNLIFNHPELNIEESVHEHYVKNNDSIIFKFLPSAITFHDNASSLNPTIYKILSNTRIYTINKPMDKKKFIQDFSNGLHEIIDTNPTIAKILEITSRLETNIYMLNSKSIPYNKSEGDESKNLTPLEGYCDSFLEIYLTINKHLNFILQCFVHESTHKLIQMIFNNNFLPFPPGSDIGKELELYPEETKNEIKIRLQNSKKKIKNSESWLNDLDQHYNNEEKISEIFPHFIGQIAFSILNNNNEEAVSYSYASMLWNYINNHFKLGLTDQKLPKFSFYENIELDYQDDAILHAEKIITQTVSFNWFDNNVGLLAFKSLTITQKYCFLTDLFNSESKFNLFASIYLSPIILNNQSFNINILLQNLLKLRDNKLKIINEHEAPLKILFRPVIQEFEQVFEYRLSNHSEEFNTPLLSYLSMNLIDENKMELLALILNKQIIEISTFTNINITDHLKIELIIEELLGSPTLTENNGDLHLAGEVLMGEIETLEAT